MSGKLGFRAAAKCFVYLFAFAIVNTLQQATYVRTNVYGRYENDTNNIHKYTLFSADEKKH